MAFAGSVRAVDPGARADEPLLGLRDDEVASAAAHGACLPEDDREHVVRLLHPALRLRDRLLGHNEHVAVLEAAGSLDRVSEVSGEVVFGA